MAATVSLTTGILKPGRGQQHVHGGMVSRQPAHHASRQTDATAPDWIDDDYDVGQDDLACDRARRLLNRPESLFARWGDQLSRLSGRLGDHSWIKRVIAGGLIVGLLASIGFGLLWWRLGEGPIGIDMATPWLAGAIKANFGDDHSVEVGGTQIERAGRIRVAVRVLDIVVRDRDGIVVASAPKAEVRLSVPSLLTGRLRAESLSLVDAELAMRIERDGRISISTGASARPIVSSEPAVVAPPATRLPAATKSDRDGLTAPAPSAAVGKDLSAALAWVDALSASGMNGYDLSEVGLKNGTLVVDDQQTGHRWTFEHITMNLRRPGAGGLALSVGADTEQPWLLRASIGPQADGVRTVDVMADRVSTKDIMIAMRMADSHYDVDLPVSGRLRGEIGRDGLPTYLTGKVQIDAGTIVDRKVPDFPMSVDRIDINVDWDASRRMLLAPFQAQSGGDRFTLLAHLEPPSDAVPDWQFGLSGGTMLFPGDKEKAEAPLIFNRIAVRVRFDTAGRRILVTQGDISNGELGIAGTATYDYSGAEPRLTLGMAGTPMSVSALKRIWPVLINPEVRDWIVTRVETGTLKRAEIAINAPVSTLARGGPPIPDDGLSINFLASGATVRPVDQMPPVRDAEMRVRITGRTANVSVAQANIEMPSGRKLTMSDFSFDIADMAPKPIQSRVKFRLDGPVPAAAEVLASERLSDFSGMPLDPATARGTVTAQLSLAMPLKNEITSKDTTYTVSADLNGFAADKLVMGQKLESNLLKIVANNNGYQVKGDVKINGQAAALDYRKPAGDNDAEVRLAATLDDASRARLGIDLGSGVTGAIPVKINGRIGSSERESRFGVEADLGQARIDNLLPGWIKSPGRAGRASFNVVRKEQSTRFEDVLIDSNGASIKGTIEIDQNGDLMSAVFPTYQPSEGDKASLRAEKTQDGVLRIVLRGDVFDGRGFLKSAVGGSSGDAKSKKLSDFDLDLKLGAVAGYNGEAVRGVDVKVGRRNGVVRSFTLNGKIGRDTPVVGDMRGRNGGRTVMYVETADAGALFRFTDTYAKMVGGQMWVAMDPPTTDHSPQEGLINVRDFAIRGESALQQVASGGQGQQQQGGSISFSRMRAEFTRRSGQLAIREGIVSGPSMGATIEGQIDYAANQVRMSGTFLPAYGLNNMFGQIPIVGLFLGGGSNEGLIGITYEVVGSPGAPMLRVNPISAIAPGVFRKVFEFGTGRQATPQDAPPPPQ